MISESNGRDYAIWLALGGMSLTACDISRKKWHRFN